MISLVEHGAFQVIYLQYVAHYSKNLDRTVVALAIIAKPRFRLQN